MAETLGVIFHRKFCLCPGNNHRDLYRYGFLGDQIRVLNLDPTRLTRLFIRPVNVRQQAKPAMAMGKNPYAKIGNNLALGSPAYDSGRFFHCSWMPLFYVALLVWFLQRIPFSFAQLKNHKSGSSGGAKVFEQGEASKFADVAGVDEAKEELQRNRRISQESR